MDQLAKIYFKDPNQVFMYNNTLEVPEHTLHCLVVQDVQVCNNFTNTIKCYNSQTHKLTVPAQQGYYFL